MLAKLRLYGWGTAMALRLGKPDHAVGFLGGIGDDLLCTAPIHELLERGARRIWFFTRHPGLYAFDARVRLVPEDPRLARLARRLGAPVRWLSYSDYDAATDRDTPLTRHVIAEMCARAGVSGRVQLRPHLVLDENEKAAAREYAGAIAIQSSGLTATLPMRNKQWPAERFQSVVDHSGARGLRFVQLGSADDPPLRGVIDRRGTLTLRESAAVLAQARLFVGIPGFLMHLARAVDCPATIVYGGREPAALTGYSCNENVAQTPPCSPCWQRNRCDFGHTCMTSISADRVHTAVEKMLARSRSPLETQEASL